MAQSKQVIQKKLIEILAKINFGNKYYKFVKKYADRGSKPVSRSAVERAITKLPGTFRYIKSEDFYTWSEAADECTIGVNIQVKYNVVEFILFVRLGGIGAGDPFAGLAADTVSLKDPSKVPDPAFPCPAFATVGELQEILQIGMTLFNEAKDAIVQSGLCTS